MKTLLLQNIGVQFVTKANIPANFIDLFAQSSGLVCAQVGITAIDDDVRRIFEPNAATISDRLSTIGKLVSIGVKTSARADPLIHGVTDSDESLSNLFSVIVKTGVKEVAINYLFLRSAIKESIEKNINDKELLAKVLEPYSESTKLPIGLKNSQGVALTKEIREKEFEQIKKIASGFGLSVHICGCKNSDITTESCHITRPIRTAQAALFT